MREQHKTDHDVADVGSEIPVKQNAVVSWIEDFLVPDPKSKEFQVVETTLRLLFGVLGLCWCKSNGIMDRSVTTQFIAVFAVLILSLASASAVSHFFERNRHRADTDDRTR